MLEPHYNQTIPVRYATEFDYCEICLKKALANNTEEKNIFQLRKALEGKNQGQKILAMRHFIICPDCMKEIVKNMGLIPELLDENNKQNNSNKAKEQHKNKKE